MTVSQLLDSVDSAELTEWMAYLQLEHERQNGKPQDEPEDIAWRRAFKAF